MNLFCKFAGANDMVVITKDDDFKTSHIIQGTPKKLKLVALGNISNADLRRFSKIHCLLSHIK